MSTARDLVDLADARGRAGAKLAVRDLVKTRVSTS